MFDDWQADSIGITLYLVQNVNDPMLAVLLRRIDDGQLYPLVGSIVDDVDGVPYVVTGSTPAPIRDVTIVMVERLLS